MKAVDQLDFTLRNVAMMEVQHTLNFTVVLQFF